MKRSIAIGLLFYIIFNPVLAQPVQKYSDIGNFKIENGTVLNNSIIIDEFLD